MKVNALYKLVFHHIPHWVNINKARVIKLISTVGTTILFDHTFYFCKKIGEKFSIFQNISVISIVMEGTYWPQFGKPSLNLTL